LDTHFQIAVAVSVVLTTVDLETKLNISNEVSLNSFRVTYRSCLKMRGSFFKLFTDGLSNEYFT